MSASAFTKGIVFAMASYLFMAFYSVFLKAAQATGGDVVWINFISYFTGAVVLLPMAIRGGLPFLRTSHLPLHLGRAFCGVLSSFLYTMSMKSIALVNATLFFNTAPLFIPILSIFMLRAKVGFRDWIAIAVGFVGVIIIIHPNADILKSGAGDLTALGAGFFLGLGYIFVKMLTATESKSLITFYFCLFASLMQFPFLFFGAHLPTWTCIGYAVASGFMMISVQFTLAAAYSYADAAKIGALQYSSLVFVGLLGWLLWDQIPSLRDVIGMVVVVIGGVLIVLQGSKPHPQIQPQTANP